MDPQNIHKIKLDIRACYLIIPIMRWDVETREYAETRGPARLAYVVVDNRETHPKQYGRYRQRNLSSDVHMYAVASAGTHTHEHRFRQAQEHSCGS